MGPTRPATTSRLPTRPRGLNELAWAMRARCDVHFDKRAVGIDPARKAVTFADGDVQAYDTLICTLPLNKALDMAGLAVDCAARPLHVGPGAEYRCHQGAEVSAPPLALQP